jgi:hypothetical protein
MSNSRSMTMIIWNHTTYTLTKLVGTATAGSVPGPNKTSPPASGSTVTISVAPGGSLSVYAGNSNGACNGTFTVSDSGNNVVFPVQYVHPSSNDPTTVKVVASQTNLACMGVNDQASPISGHDPVVNTGLYVGDAVTEWNASGVAYVAGYAAPLSATPYSGNNARDVVNSMFQTTIRKVDGVQHWYSQASAVPYLPADYSGNQLVQGNFTSTRPLVQTMLNLWPGVVTHPLTTSPDYAFIQFLANFVVPATTSSTNPPLVMYVPRFGYSTQYASGDMNAPVYQLTGYQAYPLAGTSPARFNMTNVQIFLTLLLGGSHFVNIQATNDFTNQNPSNPPANTSRNLYTQFQSTFQDNNTMSGRHSCVGNSHYCNPSVGLNTSGWYYGNQMGEWAASGCGLLLSLLVAQTTSTSQYNTFMQLEGWPADNDWVFGDGSITGGARHGEDYDAYTKSLWNISTFGAAPYSEKRATTIFLAPASWVPHIYTGTYMMPYVGAETPQGWLNTHVVTVPSGTPAPPSQYS